jgi:NitT/TauT family transport system permease protein
MAVGVLHQGRALRTDGTGRRVTVYRLLLLAGLVVLWWTAAHLSGSRFVPTPFDTGAAAVEMIRRGTLQRALADSLLVFGGGYLLAAALAIPLGILMGGVRILGATLEPYMNALTATPRVAFIPLIIVLLGLDAEAKIAIVFLGAVMPILINTYAGVAVSDPELVEMARSAGASRSEIFRKIMLPGALPFVLSGLRLGAAIGLINTVVAEVYTAVTGLGGLLATYGNTFQMAPYFVVVIALGLIGVLVTSGIRRLELRLSRWRIDPVGNAT